MTHPLPHSLLFNPSTFQLPHSITRKLSPFPVPRSQPFSLSTPYCLLPIAYPCPLPPGCCHRKNEALCISVGLMHAIYHPLKLQIELQTAHFWRWRATTKTWPGGESRRRDWQRRVPSPPEGRLSSQVATHWPTCFLGLRGMARVAVSTTCFRRPPRHEPRLRGSRIRAFGATRTLAP